jgi:hypothetical protein
MKAQTIVFHISDFDENESFESTAEAVGESRFDDAGDSRGEHLTLNATICEEDYSGPEKTITFYRGVELDESMFNLILKIFNQPRSQESITLKVESALVS